MLTHKEKELRRLIDRENSKRHLFMQENGTVLPNNPLTALLLNDRIDFTIERNSNIPKVNDVETDEVLAIQDESRKELKEREKVNSMLNDTKLLKIQLKLKDQEILQLRNEKASEIERINREITVSVSKYKSLVEDIIEERRRAVDRLADITKAPIILEYFDGNLQSSEDVINSLKSTIANKSESIETLETKIIGLNRVVASLSTSNFSMLSAKVTTLDSKIRHYEDLYKQEQREKENIEHSFKDLELKKLRVEKDYKDSIDSYTLAVKELKQAKNSNKILSQEKVDKKVIDEYEKKYKKIKLAKDATENSLKDIMTQNASLRTKIDRLNEQVIELKQEKEESLKTYLELANQTYDQNQTQDTATLERYEKEKNELRKEIEEQYSVITDLQMEVSELKEKNTQMLKKHSEPWASQNDMSNSPKNSMTG